jgi:hypothetical protein
MIIYISESGRANKKWKAEAEGQRTVHFGQAGAEDFTIHRDEAARKAYIARHGKENWGRTGVMTPGWLSRYLLWEKPSLDEAIAAASTKYRGVTFRRA